MHWSYRANAIALSGLGVGGAVLAAGHWPGDPAWAIAWAVGAALYGIVGVLLWRGVQWAAPVALGMVAFSAGVWIQSGLALGLLATTSVDATTSLRTCGTCLLGSAITLGLLLWTPRTVPFRQALSTVFAGAAVVPAVLFALVPSQAPTVAVAMGVGCVMLVAGTVALGQGRTSGLLLNLVGAIVMGGGVAFAPWISPVATANPWLPNANAFLPIVLGLCAATCAAVSTALYAAPLLRFVARRSD